MSVASNDWATRFSACLASLRSAQAVKALEDLQKSNRESLETIQTLLSEPQDEARRSELALSRSLDLALAILWSANNVPPGKDHNPLRSAAMPVLRNLPSLCLKLDDFRSLQTLQKGAGNLVEVVRSRLDSRLYVLKTVVKGIVKRQPSTHSPTFEAALLSRDWDRGGAALTPKLSAAFQSSGSVHILLEYCPGGDFYQLLDSASKIDSNWPGRSSSGGLLTEDWVRKYAIDMVAAIAWAHNQGFAHRDIKPSNFLLDKSGHLKLCDFMSAAPFSEFLLPEDALDGRMVKTRRIHGFYCQACVGTCDYIAPEILEAEAARIEEAERSDLYGSPTGKVPRSTSSSELAPENKEAGAYGPEVDWWSFGIVVYEMTFGSLPFFSSRLEATYERIKNHEEELFLDPSVGCSNLLRGFIRRLLAVPHLRLGRGGSLEVQQDPFLRGVDWSDPWKMEAPFVPRTLTSESSQDAASPAHFGGANELSILHSPQVLPYGKYVNQTVSGIDSLPNFSAIFSGDLDDFPAYADSFDHFNRTSGIHSRANGSIFARNGPDGHPSGTGMLRPNESEELHHQQERSVFNPGGIPRSTSSPAVCDPSSPYSGPLHSSPSPSMVRHTPKWSDVNLQFFGFSHLPGPSAFSPPSDPKPKELSLIMEASESVPASPCKASDLPASIPSGLDSSPVAWSGAASAAPMASTPFQKGTFNLIESPGVSINGLPNSPPFFGTPAWTAAQRNLQRRAVETASRAKVGGSSNFVTPARKPLSSNSLESQPGSAAGSRDKNYSAAQMQTPAANPSSTPAAVPPSPYPFPLASAPATSRIASRLRAAAGSTPASGLPLRRNDLARARSATPNATAGGSFGSDSRNSGGSNAVRDLSEREAWDEMMAAVQKSVRKKKKDAAAAAASATPSELAEKLKIPRSITDPELSSKSVARPPSVRQALSEWRNGAAAAAAASPSSSGSKEDIASSTAGPPTSRIERSSSQLSQNQIAPGSSTLLKDGRRNLVFPRPTVSVASPVLEPYASDPEESDPESPLSGRLTPGLGPFQDSRTPDDSRGGSDWTGGGGAGGAGGLRHRKSARQLLLKAQERATPTKPARTQSPSLTEAFGTKNHHHHHHNHHHQLEHGLLDSFTAPHSRANSHGSERNSDHLTLAPHQDHLTTGPLARSRPLSMMVQPPPYRSHTNPPNPIIFPPSSSSSSPSSILVSNSLESSSSSSSLTTSSCSRINPQPQTTDLVGSNEKTVVRHRPILGMMTTARREKAAVLDRRRSVGELATRTTMTSTNSIGKRLVPGVGGGGGGGGGAIAGGLRRKDSSETLSEYRQGIVRPSSLVLIHHPNNTKSSSLPPSSEDAFLLEPKSIRIQPSTTSTQPHPTNLSIQRCIRRTRSSHLQGGTSWGERLSVHRAPPPPPSPPTKAQPSFLVLKEDPDEEESQPTNPDDLSLLSGLGQRHNALQGSLSGLERRLANLKARLDE
ncbi:hypothetical protein IE53DRAFT_370061 [Violaceomyces palustris]|uniref:Uncharacterized protein n=1 Tax=Violaceomyces palustris TaxID=1673888 RepID=A0ACD0NTL3_9BASI|nr:hypothetical protein IE53DRAFT_370061 [Violaceomyces palustris]